MLNLQNVKVSVTLTRMALGPLESQVMELVWKLGECSVCDIARNLPEKRAYTTVMTTLTRLFHKGVLKRTRADRKFVYSARLGQQELEDAIVREITAHLLAIPASSRAREMVILSLLESLRRQDPTFFDAAVTMTKARHSLQAEEEAGLNFPPGRETSNPQ